MRGGIVSVDGFRVGMYERGGLHNKVQRVSKNAYLVGSVYKIKAISL
jgi:hypothetical protein